MHRNPLRMSDQCQDALQARYPHEPHAILPLYWYPARKCEPLHPLVTDSTTTRWNRGKFSKEERIVV